MKRIHSLFVQLATCVIAVICGTQPTHAGAIHTAQVEVVDSPPGRFVPLEVGTPRDGYYTTRWAFQVIPGVLVQQPPFYIWQVTGEPLPGESYIRTDPQPSYGKIAFNVLSDGPVLLAVTDRWSGGGNSGGGWIPELTTEQEFLADGWVKLSGILDVYDHSLDTLTSSLDPPFYYEIYKRDSLAGESFVYRTEKYHPPALLTTQFSTVTTHFGTAPEPSSALLMVIGIMVTTGVRWIQLAWK